MSNPLVQPAQMVGRASDEAGLLSRATRVAGIGAWRCDLADDRLAWTEAVYGLFGVEQDRPINRNDIVSLYDDESRDTLERVRADAIASRSGFSLEARIVRPDAEVRWIRINADYDHVGGRAGLLFGIKQDITAERKRWEALRKIADCDALTGLASRGTFQRDFLDAPLGGNALIVIDIDGFKPINDRFGHAAGDTCLVTVAQRLRAAFSDAAMVARIGGDEFAVVASGSTQTVVARVHRALHELALPMPWRGDMLRLTASAGVAVPVQAAGRDAESLFVAADQALYSAKRAGRNRLAVAPHAEVCDQLYAFSIR